MTRRTALVVALVAALAACTRSHIRFGNPVQPEEAAAILPGASKASVLTRLGPPDRVGVEPGGSVFEYLYSRTAARTVDLSLFQSSFNYEEARLRVDRLRVGFDRAGAVRYVAVVPGHDDSMPD
jgi:outer membrane protein assembly factor BamE (lipoprotein component of BamABCDE complex)